MLLGGLTTFFVSGMGNNLRDTVLLEKQQSAFLLKNILDSKFQQTKAVLPTNDISGESLLVENNLNFESNTPFSLIKLYQKINPEPPNNKYLMVHNFTYFQGITKDSNIYFSDTYANTIRKWPNGDNEVEKIIGLNNPTGIVIDGNTLYIADTGNHRIVSYNESNIPALTEYPLLTDLLYPTGLAYKSPYLYIADSFNNKIFRYKTNANPNTDMDAFITFAGTGESGDDGDGGKAINALLHFPTGLAISTDQKYLFVADSLNHKVRAIELDTGDNKITTLVGSNTFKEGSDCNNKKAKTCKLLFPTGLDVRDNELFISDSGNNRILKVFDSGDPILNGSKFEVSIKIPQDLSLDSIKIDYPDGSETLDLDINMSCFTAPPCETPPCDPTLCDQSRKIISSNHAARFQYFVGQQMLVGTGAVANTVKLETVNTVAKTLTVSSALSDHYIGTKLQIQLAKDADIKLSLPLKSLNFDIDTINGDQAISIHFIATDTSKNFTTYKKISRSDKLLGTTDDSIIEYMTSLNFPTGLVKTNSDLIFANSLQKKVRTKSTPIKSKNVSDISEIMSTFTGFLDDVILEGTDFETLNFEHDEENRIIHYKLKLTENRGVKQGISGSIGY